MEQIIFSDLHGNLRNLRRIYEENETDSLTSLGDVVNLGKNYIENRCLDFLKEKNIQEIQGNHERDTARVAEESPSQTRISPSNLEHIKALPRSINHSNLLYTHENPSENQLGQRIRTLEDAIPQLTSIKEKYPNTDICFFGHTHQPLIFYHNKRKNKFGQIKQTKKFITLRPECIYLINPGTAGIANSSPPTYIIFNSEKKQIKFKEIE